MPRRKSSSTPHRRSQASSIARLRKVGLTKSQAGKPGKRPGGSAYALLRRFKPVLEKRAAVVKAPPKVARSYKSTFTTTRNRIIVPKSPGESVRLAKKAGEIRKRKVVIPGERPIRMRIPPAIRTIQDLEKPFPPGTRFRVAYGYNHREHRPNYLYFANQELLADFLSGYGIGDRFNIGFIEVIPP